MTETTSVAAWEAKVERVAAEFPLRRFRLRDMDDEELLQCSKALGIGLSLEEMQDARAYFQKRGDAARAAGDPRADALADPTDVELEALGQAWSEHCCYKSSKPVLRDNVYGIAEDRIVAREDAGIVEFDADHYYAVGLESHNHPSAIEPYGGAATGVGGILRDVVCMGAQPVALVDPLFFGPLDTRHEDLPSGVKHPRFLLDGVVSGIRDYGNRTGIPTVAGGITFHPKYTQNCLVNVGCIGIVRKDMLMHSKAGAPGDVFVYLGNSTGRDGIHGVSFASEELSEESEESSRSAVQVGDAILKEPLMHVTLEVIEKGLATGCKDFGGGGLSCVAGELAYDAGFGCEIDLDKVPTKVPGMEPWEIWVSESQERMMVTAKPEDVDAVLHIARKWDVPAFVVGRVIEEPVNRVRYQGVPVLDLELRFSTGGPEYARPAADIDVDRDDWVDFEPAEDLGGVLEWMMRHPSVMSKEWVVRQYDHEVRANTVLKPLQGRIGSEGPGDAAVIKPVATSDKALALCSDVNPYYTERDPYWGSASAIDETVRNLAAVGARVSSVCDNLNFGNPEKPDRMWQLRGSTRGLGDMARVLGIPFSSGNVSLYNETAKGAIPPTPTIMGVGILDDFRHATTMDLKAAGNRLYLVGHTHRELGGSLYMQRLGLDGERVPQTDAQNLKRSAEAVVAAIEQGLVRAAHDCSEGGLAVALAEMCFAGGLGAEVDATKVGAHFGGPEADADAGPPQVGADAPGGGRRDAPKPADRSDLKLFSESNTRWILEVPTDKAETFEAIFSGTGLLYPLGAVTDGTRLHVRDGQETVLDADTARLREIWAHELPRLMGVEGAGGAGKTGATDKTAGGAA